MLSHSRAKARGFRKQKGGMQENEARVAADAEKNENETVVKLRALREELDRVQRGNNEL